MLLKSLFHPLQPSTLVHGLGTVCYKEFKPSLDLSDYVYCYWQLSSAEPLEHEFQYRVVSDGCIDILINRFESKVYITGFSKHYLEYNLGRAFDYIGIRFYPFQFPLLFDISAAQLVDTFVNLEALLPDLNANIQSKICTGDQDWQQQFDLLLKHHLTKPNRISSLDARLINAIDQILRSGGNTPIHRLNLALSQRQLRRFFKFYFGESPKVFAKVLRFQNVLKAYMSQQNGIDESVFYETGYYDQAHFIRDFKRFYGVTPSQVFGDY
ncbi:MAG: helix-turn-helix domain-containing protein [Bacteroidota bacterium]